MKKLPVVKSLLIAGAVTLTGLTFTTDSQAQTMTDTIAENNQEEGLTDRKLQYVANVDPDELDEMPVYEGKYDFTNKDENYLYHFYSDGQHWTWSKTPLKNVK